MDAINSVRAVFAETGMGFAGQLATAAIILGVIGMVLTRHGHRHGPLLCKLALAGAVWIAGLGHLNWFQAGQHEQHMLQAVRDPVHNALFKKSLDHERGQILPLGYGLAVLPALLGAAGLLGPRRRPSAVQALPR